jgi:hypothetical protein
MNHKKDIADSGNMDSKNAFCFGSKKLKKLKIFKNLFANLIL